MLLVALGNVLDYGSNLAYVQHVLSMDTTFTGNLQRWRAVTNPLLHHIVYIGIILYEAVMGCGLAWASIDFLKARTAEELALARQFASSVLVMTMLLWLVPFIIIGGEWFQMWQSTTWNGLTTATHNFTVQSLILLYVQTPDT